MSGDKVGRCFGERPGVYWAFFGGLTIADIAPPTAIGVVALPDADAVVALNIKCIQIKISVDY